MKASLATIAADLEAKQKANAEREAEAYLAKLVNRRTVCLALAGLFCTVAVILSLGYWTGKIHVPVGTISWLGPGLTTFSLLGAIALQQNIYQRRNAVRQDRIEEGMRTNCAKVVTEIRDARPADAIELGRLVAYMQGVEERIPVAVEEAVRKAHASGYVAGVQLHERFNGIQAAIGKLAERATEIERRIPASAVHNQLNGSSLNGHEPELGADEVADEENVVRLPTPETVKVLERFAQKIVYPPKG